MWWQLHRSVNILKNPLLGIYPRKIKSGSQRDICTPMFIVALFTVTKIWKQPKCPSTDEWIEKNICICIKWNIIQPWERRKPCLLWQHGWTLRIYAKWNKLERERQILYDLAFMWNPKKKKKIQPQTQKVD